MAASLARLLSTRTHTPPKTLISTSYSTNTTATTSSSVVSLFSSLGLSPSIARSASQKLRRKSPNHPISVLALLETFGIPKPHIAKLVEKRPLVLTGCLGILRSKLEFFRSRGFTGVRIGKLISSDPRLLRTSLANRISPNFDRLKPLFGEGDGLVDSICRAPRLLILDIHNNLLPNVEALRKRRMPESCIKKLILLKPRALFIKPHQFEQFMIQLEEMGYDFSTGMPTRALAVLVSMSISTWDRKLRLLKSLGWSEEEILEAFRRKPNCIEISDEKIKQRVSFFINNFHWNPAAIAERPIVMMLSLEKRIIPRSSVFNVLVSKRVIRRKMPDLQLFTIGEQKFLEFYVKKYQDKIPEVLDAYQGKLKLTSLEMKCNIRPNIRTLRSYNVPESSIRSLARKKSKGLLVSSAHFEAIMKGLKRMGYDFSSKTFSDALAVLGTMPNIISEGKFTFYRMLGWSDKDIFTAFKKQPYYVTVPDERVRRIVDFLKTRLNWGPTDIANSPSLLLLSLEKTIIPRYSIFNILLSKRCIRNMVPEPSFFLIGEDRFCKLYAKKYGEKFPAVLEIYSGCSTIVE